MKRLRSRRILASAALLAGCAFPSSGSPASTIPIAVRSHNSSAVDVYLLCGDREAELLGVVGQKETGFFEVPSKRARCVSGLNFFLVSHSQNRGYWVGPLRPAPGGSIVLVIEKYAGLSVASANF